VSLLCAGVARFSVELFLEMPDKEEEGGAGEEPTTGCTQLSQVTWSGYAANVIIIVIIIHHHHHCRRRWRIKQ